MPNPLLETKLYLPRAPRGLVPRPRLAERLERGTATKLTLISAPAGFGKTTLLADWMTARPGADQGGPCGAGTPNRVGLAGNRPSATRVPADRLTGNGGRDEPSR